MTVPLTWAQVNHWRLGKHFLLEQADRNGLLDVVSRIGGLQAQVMSAAELSAWARVRDLSPDDVRDALWLHRSLVKTWAMRGTLHLLTAEDFPLYIAAFRTRANYRQASWLKYFGLTLEGIEAVIEGVQEALDGRTLTREELADEVARLAGQPHLRELLLSGWGALLKPAAFQGRLCFGPSQGQTVTFVRPDQWLGGSLREVDSDEALREIVWRYLSAYGPATHTDFAHWFGIEPHKSKKLFGKLVGDLEEVDVEGWRAWALPSSLPEMSQGARPAPVRLLPNFDPYVGALQVHRDYLLAKGLKERVYRTAGWISPVVLVEGRIEGVWKYEKARSGVAVTVEMFAPPAGNVKGEIEVEAERLGRFLGAAVQVSFV